MSTDPEREREQDLAIDPETMLENALGNEEGRDQGIVQEKEKELMTGLGNGIRQLELDPDLVIGLQETDPDPGTALTEHHHEIEILGKGLLIGHCL